MPRRLIFHDSFSVSRTRSESLLFDRETAGMFAGWFMDDIRARVVPYRLHSAPRSPIAVEADSPSTKARVQVLFHSAYGHGPFDQSAEDGAIEFLRTASMLLLNLGGITHFELSDIDIEEKDKTIASYALQPIPGRVIRIGRVYIQLVWPSADEQGRSWASIPSERVWTLKLPPQLGKHSDLVMFSRGLHELDKAQTFSYDFSMKASKLYGFDLASFHSRVNTYGIGLSSRWGWDMRMLHGSNPALEYYQIEKQLRFGFTLAILREHILSQMNMLLQKLGYNATVSLLGIPTANELLESLKALRERRLSFKKALELLYP